MFYFKIGLRSLPSIAKVKENKNFKGVHLRTMTICLQTYLKTETELSFPLQCAVDSEFVSDLDWRCEIVILGATKVVQTKVAQTKVSQWKFPKVKDSQLWKFLKYERCLNFVISMNSIFLTHSVFWESAQIKIKVFYSFEEYTSNYIH